MEASLATYQTKKWKHLWIPTNTTWKHLWTTYQTKKWKHLWIPTNNQHKQDPNLEHNAGDKMAI